MHGEIAVRPIYHCSIRSGLDFTLMLLVLALTMMMLMAVMVAMMVMALVAAMMAKTAMAAATAPTAATTVTAATPHAGKTWQVEIGDSHCAESRVHHV